MERHSTISTITTIMPVLWFCIACDKQSTTYPIETYTSIYHQYIISCIYMGLIHAESYIHNNFLISKQRNEYDISVYNLAFCTVEDTHHQVPIPIIIIYSVSSLQTFKEIFVISPDVCHKKVVCACAFKMFL